MSDKKTRRPFILKDAFDVVMGHGVAYAEGNVQVNIKEHGNAAWQMQLSDVLKLTDVCTFEWVNATRRVNTPDGIKTMETTLRRFSEKP